MLKKNKREFVMKDSYEGVSFSKKLRIALGLISLLLIFSREFSLGDKGTGTNAKPLIDFNSLDERENWRVVNDGVMGGLSRSQLRITSENKAIFQGNISLENNGGFASVRTYPKDYGLSESDGLSIRIKGDGKKYQLRLRTDDKFDGVSYRATFQTVPEKWIIVDLLFKEFVPTYHGRLVPDAPVLNPNNIRQIGFLIADKQAGPFRLEIDWIGTYKN
jgi:monofunctional biosynthetic peptidoglycan transglycosylase